MMGLRRGMGIRFGLGEGRVKLAVSASSRKRLVFSGSTVD